MTIFHAVILGIVEGVTEFLPVSSTGHLIVVSKLLGVPQTESLKSFEIIIQLGAIAAVAVLYWRKFLLAPPVMKRVIVGFIPTGVLGLILYKVVKTHLLGNDMVVVWALFLGGIALIAFERLFRPPKEQSSDIAKLPYGKAALVGAAQALAMVPGVSRSAATMLAGLSLGMSRQAIVEYSFLLAVPTMLAASALDLFKSAGSFTSADTVALCVGFVVSFLTALLAVRWLLLFVKTNTFTAFGVYRIAAALVFFILLR